jgi:hypothetical protein
MEKTMSYPQSRLSAAILALLLLSGCNEGNDRRTGGDITSDPQQMHFNRIATFPVCSQVGSSCTDDAVTAAEIVAASADGMTLIYSNSPGQQVGFIDITDPASPIGLGSLALGGEPTSVAVAGAYALVAVNRSTNFVEVAGSLDVIEFNSRTLVHSIDLGGQPDSIAVSPDGRYAAVVIENERDEELDDGAPPQLPAGGLVIVDLVGAPAAWSTRTVELTGLADLYPGDPEPEYVDINQDNLAVVSLQENNHLVLVDLASGTVTCHFSAGTTDLTDIDDTDESPALISLTASQSGVMREPDGVAWINNDYFATADEGDLDGGSRGFTIFNRAGEVVFASGNQLDQLAVRLGHYPDGRSDNKGNEPENVEVGIFGKERFLFVASERSSLILVYDAADPLNPVFKQALPTGAAPEGVLAIPSRNLLVTASEEDSRADTLRSSVTLYRYGPGSPQYPTITAADRADGKPIPWGALSGLAADQFNEHVLYAIDDSYYQRNRIFTLDISQKPAVLTQEIYLRDEQNVLAGLPAAELADATVAANHPRRANLFDAEDLKLLINADKTVNLDPEGIAQSSDGGFWIASEGDGTIDDPKRPINSLNLVIKTDPDGVINEVFPLPKELNAKQIRFGFEGIAEDNGLVYIALQRPWSGESHARIAVLDPADGSWKFLFYPLDEVTSPNGGWVGLSDLTALGNGEFLVVERDNQAGPDARVKKLYRFCVTDLAAESVISKTLARDLMADLSRPGGLVLEKIEGLAVTRSGDIYIVNDNDGVDSSNGETQLLNLGRLLD